MPAAKSPSNGKGTHSLTLKFTEPEDIALYDALEAAAKSERRPLAIFVLLQLHTNNEVQAPTK